MTDMHGLVYAFHSFPELGALQIPRTAASLPFGGRYRLIDFILSSMTNAGIRDVGVIMQKDYQSLLDHIRGGKAWDMARMEGGLTMLPPFGAAGPQTSEYRDSLQALTAIRNYVSRIRQKYVVLGRGNLLANIDLTAAYDSHIESGCEITAICSDHVPSFVHHRFTVTEDNVASDILCVQTDSINGGVTSLEVYIMSKAFLLELIDHCNEHSYVHFHREGLKWMMANDKKVNIYMHEGYSRYIASVQEYFKSSMDMFNREIREEVFTNDRPIKTRETADVSTYYSDGASTKNCLIADGCQISGTLENCIVFRGSVIEKGAVLKNCIIMQSCKVEADANIQNLICDKNVTISSGTCLTGSPVLPHIIPKDTTL